MFRTTSRLSSSRRSRILPGLVECLGCRFCVRFWNDRPSIIEGLCCSRIYMYAQPSLDCRNRDYSKNETHGRPHKQMENTNEQCKLLMLSSCTCRNSRGCKRWINTDASRLSHVDA